MNDELMLRHAEQVAALCNMQSVVIIGWNESTNEIEIVNYGHERKHLAVGRAIGMAAKMGFVQWKDIAAR